jgi:hypothetical protein
MTDVEKWISWGGWAAVIGGAMWSVKAGVILLGGEQPDYLFELAPLALGIAILALHAFLNGQGGKLATAGQIVAVATILATIINGFEEALADEEWIQALSSFVDMVAGLGPIVGLILLGLAGRDTMTGWRLGPLKLAAIYPLSVMLLIPLAPFVDFDGATGERLIEIPILAIGVGWIMFGVEMIRGETTKVEPIAA